MVYLMGGLLRLARGFKAVDRPGWEVVALAVGKSVRHPPAHLLNKKTMRL
jgi:hypothetical protein